MKKIKQVRSSGNVFSDLGFGPQEAENLHLRARLMAEIQKYIEREEITQAEAADRFGVTQPRISNLLRGKIHLFSVDTLITMLSHAGLRVDIRIKKARAA
jgi:predicted XRE-type DNA-binding protein